MRRLIDFINKNNKELAQNARSKLGRPSSQYAQISLFVDNSIHYSRPPYYTTSRKTTKKDVCFREIYRGRPIPNISKSFIDHIEQVTKLRTQKLLNNILSKSSPDSIRYFVIEQAFEYHDPETFFHDLLDWGCTNEVIIEAMGTKDRRAFFNKYYDEIEELRIIMEETKLFLPPVGDKRDWLSTAAFEATAFIIASEIRLDIVSWRLSLVQVSPMAFDKYLLKQSF